MYNPAKGYISMANNRFALDSYDVRASMHEIVPGRAYRIHNIFEDKIAQGHKFTFQDMIDMQLDLKD